jgi:hypothetical protein
VVELGEVFSRDGRIKSRMDISQRNGTLDVTDGVVKSWR